MNAWDPTGLVVRKLTELAAERGLSVSWNGGSGSNWAVSVSGYTFTLNRQYENGDYSLYLNGLAQDAGQLSLHSDDNKVYIDDGLFDCTIDDDSGATDLIDQWVQGFPITHYVQAITGTRNGRALTKEERTNEWFEAAAIIEQGAIFMSTGISDVSGGTAVSIKSIGNNRMANKVSQRLGYEGAEALKADFVGKAGSHFDIMKNTTTNEIILHSKKGVLVPTGLFIP